MLEQILRGSVDLVTAHAGIARDTAHRWVAAKGLPAHHIHQPSTLRRGDVDQWVRAGGAIEADSARGGPT